MERLADDVYNSMFSYGPTHDYVNTVESKFPLSSSTRNKLWDMLSNTSASEIKSMSEIFQQKYGRALDNSGPPKTLQEIMASRLSEADMKNFGRLLSRQEEVPVTERVDGATLRSDLGKDLKVGEVNRGIQLPDGRTMDIFIPRNARQPLPLMVVLNGARLAGDPDPGADGKNPGVMERETGLNMVASDKGFAIAYVYAKSPNNTGNTAWNMIGDINNPFKNGSPTDNSYDDVNYLDNAINKAKSLLRIDNSRVGLTGFSDGARALQQYAAIRPDQVSSVMIGEGYSFSNDRKFDTSKGPEALPENTNIAAMIVHGTNDMMVPYNQGREINGKMQGQGWYIWAARNLQGLNMPGADYVTPWAQANNWKAANSLSTLHSVKFENGEMIERYADPSKRRPPVEEHVIVDGNHAWNSWQNQAGGLWFLPYTSPNRSFDFSNKFGQFLIENPKKK
jgi:poly(3-hydroxybutyrate) depolymerase